MEKNIVTGRFESAECGVLSAESASLGDALIPHPSSLIPQKGFSLLELMIAMFILIILISVAVPTYQRSVQLAREVVLKENLWQMRRSIDQYKSDKSKAPQSVEDLVTGKYLLEVPLDPISDKREWNEVQNDDSNASESEQGMKNVKSLADGEDAEGKRYDEY